MPLAGGIASADVDLRRVERHKYVFEQGSKWLKFTSKNYVRDIVDFARQIMTESIGQNVYAVPPSPRYQRTQRLWQGVRSKDFDKGVAAGEIYIDPDIRGHNDYWYPVSVEFGLERWPRYWGRRYWAKGYPEIRAMFDAEIYRMFLATVEHFQE